MGLWTTVQRSPPALFLLGYVFIISGLIANLLQLITCIIWPFDKSLYRKIIFLTIEYQWYTITATVRWWAGLELVVVTEEKNLDFLGKHCLLTMNHKSGLDWLITLLVGEHCGVLGGQRNFAKYILKFMPIMGWSSYFGECIFLKRNMEKDKKMIQNHIRELSEYPWPVWLVLLCEGTRYSDAKRDASNEVARKKGIPELKHHLLPRTKGFATALMGLKGKYHDILDFTPAFSASGAEPTLMNIIEGRKCILEIYVRKIKIDDLTLEKEADAEEVCHEIYRKKDELYDSFLKNGRFEGNRFTLGGTVKSLVVTLLWSILLLVPLFYSIALLVLRGSLFLQIGFVVLVGIVALLARKLMTAGDVEAYSSPSKQNNSKKQN